MTTPPAAPRERVLIIKLGALGDFVQALGLLRALRAHHATAHITLLTTAPYESLARASFYVDDILIDTRPRFPDLQGWLRLRRQLRKGGFARIYDLQNNDRTALYRRLSGKDNAPLWITTAQDDTPAPATTAQPAHAFDRLRALLAKAGIPAVTPDDLGWLMPATTPEQLGVKPPYVLLVPGSAPARPEKRWPASHYAALARALVAQGVQPVILGTAAEQDAATFIRTAAGDGNEPHTLAPRTLDLCGRTTIADLPALARGASAAIGNDTGPMHLIAATGCPSCVLFSRHSIPARHAPRGPAVHTLQEADLADLAVTRVTALLPQLLRLP